MHVVLSVSKQYNPREDAAERGISSVAILFGYVPKKDARFYCMSQNSLLSRETLTLSLIQVYYLTVPILIENILVLS